jgi:hypothetical protein
MRRKIKERKKKYEGNMVQNFKNEENRNAKTEIKNTNKKAAVR